MRKLFAFLFVAMLTGFASFAQIDEAFQRGTNIIHAGVGIGIPYWGGAYSSGSLPVSLHASYERGITDQLGIGFIGIGAQVGYATQKYIYQGHEEWTGSGLMVAARASYHLVIPGLPEQQFDPYAGVLLGLVFTSYNYDPGYAGGYYDGKAGSTTVGIYGGMNYHFNSNFGVYGELGYTAFAILNVGVAFKF
jgi:hypothetical protein